MEKIDFNFCNFFLVIEKSFKNKYICEKIDEKVARKIIHTLQVWVDFDVMKMHIAV